MIESANASTTTLPAAAQNGNGTNGNGATAANFPLAARFAPTFDPKEHNTLRKTLVPFACWRAEDLRFDFASSFVRPEISGELSELRELIDRHTLLNKAGTPELREKALGVYRAACSRKLPLTCEL